MKLKDALKIFNKKEDGKQKEYTIENAEDVVNIVNEITADQISKFQEQITELFQAVGDDIEQLSTDLSAVQDSIKEVLGNGGGDGSGDGSSGDGDPGVQNNDPEGDPKKEDPKEDKLDKILNSITDIGERVEKLEGIVEKVKKQPTVKNKAFIKNLNKNKERKGIFNRE